MPRWELKFGQYWDNQEAESRMWAQESCEDLTTDIARTLDLDPVRSRALVAAAEPVVKLMVQHWRLNYQEQFKRRNGDWGHRDFWADFGSVMHTPEAAARRKAMRSEFAKILETELTANELKKWRTEAAIRRERAFKAVGRAVEMRVEAASDRMKEKWRNDLLSIAQDAGSDDALMERLDMALDTALESYEALYRQRIQSVLPEWKIGDFIVTLKKLDDLERRGTMVMYVPDENGAEKAARDGLDAAVKSLLSPNHKARMSESGKKLQAEVARLTDLVVERVLEDDLAAARSYRDDELRRALELLKLSEDREMRLRSHMKQGEDQAVATWKAATARTVTSEIALQSKGKVRADFLKDVENRNWWFDNDHTDDVLARFYYGQVSAAVAANLNLDDQNRWKAFDASSRYQAANSWAELAVSELDSRLHLLPEQRVKIEDMVMAVTREVVRIPKFRDAEVNRTRLDVAPALINGVGIENLAVVLNEDQMNWVRINHKRHERTWRTIKAALDKILLPELIEMP